MADALAAEIQRATALLGQDPAQAEALAQDILSRAPGDLDAQAVLGAALRARGAFAEALAVLAPLADSPGAGWIAAFELARTRLALGHSRDAVAPLERAVALNPGLAPAWRLLADIRLFAGDVGGARAASDHLARAQTADPRVAGAADAIIAGRLQAAESALRTLLNADAGLFGAALLLAEVLARTGRLAHAEALLAEVLVQAPGFAQARLAYAGVLQAGGKLPAAVAELNRLLNADPQNVRARILLTSALAETGDFAGAAALTEGLLRAFPDQPNGWLLHGHGLRTLGRIDEAISAYQRCLVLAPGRTEALWALANLKTYRFGAAERAAIAERLADPALAPVDQANLHFTLGKALEDAGEARDAFGHYRRGNALERARRAYDADAAHALVERSKVLYTAEFFAERAGWGAAAEDPIFIVGLPRSGSTLVDQILASHPLVEGTRELQEVQLIADWVAMQGGAYPGPAAGLSRERCAELGRNFLDWTAVQRRLGRPHFTDKAPWNVLHTGLIQLILPNARIVDVRRHPMACGLSIYRQHFIQGWDFSYDLSDIGRYYADYVALMAHFDTVLPGRVQRVTYEDLVADPEAAVRALLAGLGLPFDPACLRFFENQRPVATPSSEQVRRPIFTDANDAWQALESELEPLRTALGPVLDAYPSAP